MTESDHLQPLVAAQYGGLADLLASVPEQEWELQSLCSKWRIREVIAHVTMPARYDQEAFMEELRAHQFDFTALSNDIAMRDGKSTIADLLDDLRSDRLHRWTPPEGGYLGALNHVVIHGLDVTVPLGIEGTTSGEALRIVLEDLTEGGTHQHFGTDLSGRKLEATNVTWSFGTGRILRGSASDLALMLCGRDVPSDRLDGDPL